MQVAVSQDAVTQRAFQARRLEFRAFALAAFDVLVASTGLWLLWPFSLALPLVNIIGLGLAIAAWRIRERSPRFVAPLLACVHTFPLLFFAYLGWAWWLR